LFTYRRNPDLIADGKAWSMLLRDVRPVGNALPGYTASYALSQATGDERGRAGSERFRPFFASARRHVSTMCLSPTKHFPSLAILRRLVASSEFSGEAKT
jgi:hypothetical protein